MSKMVAWSSLVGPKGMPRVVVDYWRDALLKISVDPDWREANAKLGGQPAIKTFPHPENFMREQESLYRKLAKAIQVSKDNP
jgi:tripartite-type tricarboxylate transporter receptor subunit TctC